MNVRLGMTVLVQTNPGRNRAATVRERASHRIAPRSLTVAALFGTVIYA
jgi:hypothetical protein